MWIEALHPQVRLRLVASASRNFYQNDSALLPHALARRMSPLQKCLVDAAYLLSLEAPEAFQASVLEGGCPIVFASAFGELQSNLAMLLALRRRELPLSPTSFQHSVHNCPVGYLSIAFKLRNPITTLSAGFLSNEKALSLAACLLAWQGVEGDRCLVLCSDEAHDDQQPELLARAQALLVERVPTHRLVPGIYLERCHTIPEGHDTSGPVEILDEEAMTNACASLPGRALIPFPYTSGAQARRLRSAGGETLETRWISRP